MANTSAPISETAVANMAVDILEDRQLTSIDDDTSLGRFMAREFGYARDELLRSYPWNFAKRRQSLAPTDAPAFEWLYQYVVPADCLRVLPLTVDGLEDSPPIPYEKEGDRLLTNCGPVLRMKYIARVTNAATFDPLFARALGCRLAGLAAQRVTGKSSFYDRSKDLYQQAMNDAMRVDSLERGLPPPILRFESASVLEVRGRGM